MALHLHTKIDIDAPPEAVWTILRGEEHCPA